MIDRKSLDSGEVIVFAGVPSDNMAMFHRVRFHAHDPVVWIGGRDWSAVIVRDVELPRAKASGRADEVFAYEAFTPAGGLPGDRVLRSAASAVECLRRRDVRVVYADRSLALVYADAMMRAGVDVRLDVDLGIVERRQKDASEVDAMRRAQRVTEDVIERTLRQIAQAEADSSGRLLDPLERSSVLTSERVRTRITGWLAAEGLAGEGHIVAGGAQGADCHEDGHGELRTGEPIIIDVFPHDPSSGYHGDCTRCVVHADVPDEVAAMHAAVVEAKSASLAACRAGVSGGAVHRAAVDVLASRGYQIGFPPDGAPSGPGVGWCSMPHGTGHGIGLELKEPPLLDENSDDVELLAGDVVTIEPGLYKLGVGGIRLEDLVVVREDGVENLNRLPEGLDWR